MTKSKEIAEQERLMEKLLPGQYGLYILSVNSSRYRLMLAFRKAEDAIEAGYHYQDGKQGLRNQIRSWEVLDYNGTVKTHVIGGEKHDT
jgi:hypothetical protein